ncbi:hypothetical protein [uncultured Mediterranean phage uvMED]|nr:hypothetical protein [uncultured Mediterranean phage uvMED]
MYQQRSFTEQITNVRPARFKDDYEWGDADAIAGIPHESGKSKKYDMAYSLARQKMENASGPQELLSGYGELS